MRNAHVCLCGLVVTLAGVACSQPGSREVVESGIVNPDPGGAGRRGPVTFRRGRVGLPGHPICRATGW